jgi:deoxyribose-phosphate aldolase
MQKEDIARLIDHTLLKPETTFDDIERVAGQAIYHGFYSVCVPSSYVQHASDVLSGSKIAVVSTIGFPLGNSSTQSKIDEAETAILHGADELDIVINIGWMLSNEYDRVLNELSDIINNANPTFMSENEKIITKVIIETSMLSDSQKVTATQIATDAGADFVKTSTGFNGSGATIEDVKLMLDSGAKQVKASGGVNNYKKLMDMVNAGATRIGTSSGISILSEFDGKASNVSSGDY